MNTTSTDSLKTLAARTGLTIPAIRAIAHDLGLALTYRADRRTWVLDEPAPVVTMFGEHLAEIIL